MEKPPDRRTAGSVDKKKSNQNPHLSDEQLLLALDGELSAREATHANLHLQACWSCRARREQIEQAIGDVVEYRNYLMKPYFPLSKSGRTMFVAQLQHLTRTVPPPTLWSRIIGAFRASRAISNHLIPRQVWLSALVMASLALFLFTRLWKAPQVSASQLLENAQVFEARALRNVAKPVVYQKLQIRIDSKALTRTIFRDSVGRRQADHIDVTGDGGELAGKQGSRRPPPSRPDGRRVAEVEIRQTFRAARLNWEDPLSPASYNAWHNSLKQMQDEVTQAGKDFIVLKTTTPEGPIAEAHITLRTVDFHPVAEDFRLKDSHQVEVNELAWEVISLEALNPDIFAPEPRPSPAVVRSENLRPPPSLGPTKAELAEAELQARMAIHAERADLGEQLELDANSDQRAVVVRGIVSTPKRKNDLESVLRGIPHVKVRLQTVEESASVQNQIAVDEWSATASKMVQEAQTQENPVALGSPGAMGHETTETLVSTPALEQQLEERFPKSEDRAAFVNQAVELVQDAMAQAWALRRLRDRYTPDTVAELSRGSQQTLGLLIRDHVSELRQHADAARNMVLPLLSAEPVLAPQTSPLPETALFESRPSLDWRSAVTEIFPEIQKMHDNVATLLAGSGASASETQTLVRDLRLALGQLETQLPVLYQSVSGPFLNVPQNIEVRADK